MNRLLVVSEKYNQSLMIYKSLFEHGVIDQDTLIDSIHVMPMSWWHFRIPSRIPMSSIPFSEKPGFSDLTANPNVVDTENLTPPRPGLLSRFDCTLQINAGSADKEYRLSFNDLLPGKKNPVEVVANRIDDYDQIILSPDFDGSGISSLFRWIDFLDHELAKIDSTDSFLSAHRNIRLLRLMALDSTSVYESYQSKMSPNDESVQRVRIHGDSKRIFDYWWFYNSAAVFSKLQRDIGIKNPRIISKYELMTLHLLSRWGMPIPANNLIGAMDSWLGSGKYKPYHCFVPGGTKGFRAQCLNIEASQQALEGHPDGVWGQIGSAMSRHKILENLKTMDLIDCNESLSGDISISEKGIEFLSYCHKSTFDPDLPFRLSIWCANGDYEKMARYIRTVFGKQKRYLSKLNIN